MRLVSRLTVGALLLITVGILWPAPRHSESASPGANGKIAFQTDRDANEEVYVMSSGGLDHDNLTENAASDEAPSWSHDGTKIAFHSNRDLGNFDIYSMNANGTGLVRLTTNSGVDEDAVWSPDKTYVAFQSDRDGNEEIYVMESAGDSQTNLTVHPSSDTNPAWSPDGLKIAFGSTRTGNEEIFVMNQDGTSPLNRTNNPSSDTAATWSPDGRRIAFVSDRDGNHEVYSMNADGSDQINLSGNTAVDQSPSWAPDGSKILFQSDRDGDQEIYVMNADGSGQTRVKADSADDVLPDWQPLSPFQLADADGDGCSDKREFQTYADPPRPGSETSGGLRNPNNFWDYADMPVQAAPGSGIYVRDKMVRVNDILAVMARYYTDDANGTATVNRNTNPLSTPPDKAGYHPAFDRTYAGPNLWNLGPPNGEIRINDILAVIYQYFHDCA